MWGCTLLRRGSSCLCPKDINRPDQSLPPAQWLYSCKSCVVVVPASSSATAMPPLPILVLDLSYYSTRLVNKGLCLTLDTMTRSDPHLWNDFDLTHWLDSSPWACLETIRPCLTQTLWTCPWDTFMCWPQGCLTTGGLHGLDTWLPLSVCPADITESVWDMDLSVPPLGSSQPLLPFDTLSMDSTGTYSARDLGGLQQDWQLFHSIVQWFCLSCWKVLKRLNTEYLLLEVYLIFSQVLKRNSLSAVMFCLYIDGSLLWNCKECWK